MQNSMAEMRSGTILIGETEAELRVGECSGEDDGGRADREKLTSGAVEEMYIREL